jgi:hypothetical protein
MSAVERFMNKEVKAFAKPSAPNAFTRNGMEMAHDSLELTKEAAYKVPGRWQKIKDVFGCFWESIRNFFRGNKSKSKLLDGITTENAELAMHEKLLQQARQQDVRTSVYHGALLKGLKNDQNQLHSDLKAEKLKELFTKWNSEQSEAFNGLKKHVPELEANNFDELIESLAKAENKPHLTKLVKGLEVEKSQSDREIIELLKNDQSIPVCNLMRSHDSSLQDFDRIREYRQALKKFGDELSNHNVTGLSVENAAVLDRNITEVQEDLEEFCSDKNMQKPKLFQAKFSQAFEDFLNNAEIDEKFLNHQEEGSFKSYFTGVAKTRKVAIQEINRTLENYKQKNVSAEDLNQSLIQFMSSFEEQVTLNDTEKRRFIRFANGLVPQEMGLLKSLVIRGGTSVLPGYMGIGEHKAQMIGSLGEGLGKGFSATELARYAAVQNMFYRAGNAASKGLFNDHWLAKLVVPMVSAGAGDKVNAKIGELEAVEGFHDWADSQLESWWSTVKSKVTGGSKNSE